MCKNIKWFLEGFTKKYYKKHPIVTIFFYTLTFIAIYALFLNKVYLSNIEEMMYFLIKLVFVFFILGVMKKISEKI